MTAPKLNGRKITEPAGPVHILSLWSKKGILARDLPLGVTKMGLSFSVGTHNCRPFIKYEKLILYRIGSALR